MAGDHIAKAAMNLAACVRPATHAPEEDWREPRAVLDQRNSIGFGFTAREVVMMGRYPHFSATPRRAR